MCTADMATMVHSDTCSLLHGETLGKQKKTRKTKGSYPDPSKTIENNQKNQKNQRSQQDVNSPPVTSYHQVLYYRGICWFSSKMYSI